MEPLSKLALNNQIVSMRHIVRKSKVHTINKLSREAKKLKAKKGSEEQIVKNKNKAERFVNELMVIKKLNDDAVTKYALQNEVPSATILNSIDITLETRARARLAGHKFIVDAIQSFRSKYPDWKLCITDLLNELGSKQRAKNKPNHKKKDRAIKELKTKVTEKNNKTNTNVEEFDVAEYESGDVTESEGYETDSYKSDISVEETQFETVQSNNLFHTGSNTESEEEQDNKIKPVISNKTVIRNINLNNKSNPNVKTLQEPKLPTIISNSLTNKDVDNIDSELETKTFKRKSEQSLPNRVDFKKKRVTEDEIKPVCETIDSFFMTTDDKDYMSVYKPPPATERNPEDNPIEYPKSTKEFFIKGKKVTVGRNNMGNRRERRQQQVEEQVDTSLHPSWEAKRKQKSLAKFEGKKITFDDQD